MEIVVVFIIVALLLGVLVWLFRYSKWGGDHSEKKEPPPTTVLPVIPGPKPVAGWEWEGLDARDATSLIPPDPDFKYIVRINDDNSFSVKRKVP